MKYESANASGLIIQILVNIRWSLRGNVGSLKLQLRYFLLTTPACVRRSLIIAGRVFDRGRLLELIMRSTKFCLSTLIYGVFFLMRSPWMNEYNGLILMPRCNANFVYELVLELEYHLKLLIEYLNMSLLTHNSDSCVTLKVLNSEGATSDCSTLFEESSQKGENIWVVLILQMTTETGAAISQGLIAQLQVKDCWFHILMPVAWKVFMDYSILVLFFLFGVR